MKPREPLPLYHSWPLFDRDEHFDLGFIIGQDVPMPSAATLSLADQEKLAFFGLGIWECDLADNGLSWTAGVYDIFGLPRGAKVSREDAVSLYCDESRDVMERLRAYAIKHRRGFTVDVEIRPALTERRWMRLTAAPVCEDNRVVRLHGLKRLV